jgi:hypothetical protein
MATLMLGHTFRGLLLPMSASVYLSARSGLLEVDLGVSGPKALFAEALVTRSNLLIDEATGTARRSMVERIRNALNEIRLAICLPGERSLTVAPQNQHFQAARVSKRPLERHTTDLVHCYFSSRFRASLAISFRGPRRERASSLL